MRLYDHCGILQLKTFFEISETGNLHLLIIDMNKDEKNVDNDLLVETWENILREYAKRDSNRTLKNAFETSDEMHKRSAEFCEIQGMLLYLIGAYKQEYVDRLNELGYPINQENHEEMIKSIQRNHQRSRNIATQVQLMRKEIENSTGKSNASFDSVMASLASNLNFEPKEDITVLRYLEYKKIIRERNKQRRLNKRRGVPMA
jgi:hypothetical protein